MLKTRKFPSPNSDLSFESQTGMSNSLRDMPSWVLQKHLKLTVFQTELLGPPCPYQEMVSSVTQIKTSEVLLDSFLPSYSPPFPQHPQPFSKFLPILISKIPLESFMPSISMATTSVLATTISSVLLSPLKPTKSKIRTPHPKGTAETATNSSYSGRHSPSQGFTDSSTKRQNPTLHLLNPSSAVSLALANGALVNVTQEDA